MSTNDNDNEELQLDDDEEWQNYREKRMEEMKRQALQQEDMRLRQHGQYTEVAEEKEFLKLSTTTKRVICHFYKKDFQRCRIVDKHLEILANRHFETKFLKLNVETAPFFVEKLAIRMLPCIIMFIDGKVVDRVVGFEELGGKDTFTTERLEHRIMVGSDVLVAKKSKKKDNSIFGYARKSGSDSEDNSDDEEEE